MSISSHLVFFFFSAGLRLALDLRARGPWGGALQLRGAWGGAISSHLKAADEVAYDDASLVDDGIIGTHDGTTIAMMAGQRSGRGRGKINDGRATMTAM